jgi:hypothetical protein
VKRTETLPARVGRGEYDRYLLPSVRRETSPAFLATQESILWDPSGTTVIGPSEDMDVLTAQEDLGWIALNGGGSFAYGGIQLADRWQVLRLLGGMVYRNPIAANIVNNYCYFISGPGFSFDLADDGAKDEFDAWAEEVDLFESIEEMVYTTSLFGESFIVGYKFRELGPKRPAVRPEAEGERDYESFRVLDPFAITEIATNPDDAKEVWGYYLRSASETTGVWLHPDDVIHVSFRRPCRQVHAAPLLFPAIVPLNQIEKFAENRYWLNFVRARFPVIRQALGPAAPSAEKEAKDPKWQKLPPPGTIFMDKGNVNWHFPSLNIGSGDVWEDWRVLVLRIASAVSLPEYLVVMDASNSNYSSTLVAESPAHHLFKSLQSRVARRLMKMLAWFHEEKIKVTPAPIINRDRNDDSQALAAARDRGAISRQTYCDEMGFEWEGMDGERARIEKERELGLGPVEPGAPEEEGEEGEEGNGKEKGNGEPEKEEKKKGKRPALKGAGRRFGF